MGPSLSLCMSSRTESHPAGFHEQLWSEAILAIFREVVFVGHRLHIRAHHVWVFSAGPCASSVVLVGRQRNRSPSKTSTRADCRHPRSDRSRSALGISGFRTSPGSECPGIAYL